MLKIWGRRNSANVQKVMWLVGEVGLAHERIDAGGPFGGLNDPKFLAMNPHGRVPVIEDDGAIVWESHSILRYLAARHQTESLWASDPAERSLADRWMDWTLASLQPAFGGVFLGFYRTPESKRNWPAIDAAVESCAEQFELLDRHLARQPYLAGDRLTLADFTAGTLLYRYFEMEIKRPDIPYVKAWYERLSERPAYREHVMIPFEDMRG